ncbi:MAG: tetratricopeptide repeat protein [Gammaproteobacteria bacterium]|nr:tetratricopeptide repeat protein [Gammaproteobacteria bacterium]
MSFLTELKRRNVLRVAAAYALVSWILIEAGSVLLPTFGAPDSFFRIYVIIVIAGFLLSIVAAWVFEVTPDGVKRERDIDRSSYVPDSSGRKNTAIIALLVVALGISITFNITGMRGSSIELTVTPKPSLESIAVLPFDSRSPNEEDQYFADGIHDDILTRLAEIESLRVISRTSVNEYRGSSKNMRQIGEELGVSVILEGAVQRAGDQVRITVQLIDAATDEHLWADSFDRDYSLQGIFELQTEISNHIISSMRADLSPEDRSRLSRKPTDNPEAYVEFVKGTRNLGERSFASLTAAVEHFETAIALDQNYAQAHAKLAETLLVLHSNHTTINQVEAFERAQAAISSALTIDPGLAEAYAALGLLEFSRWEQTQIGNGNVLAANAFDTALDINPNLANAYVWYASLRSREGALDEAIDHLTTALTIDPLSRIPYVNLPSFLAMQGQNEEATRILLEAIRIFDSWETPYRFISTHLQRLGRLDEAIAWGRQANRLSADPLYGGALLAAYQDLGDEAAMNAFYESFPTDHPLLPIGESFALYTQGDYEAARTKIRPFASDSRYPRQFVYPILINSSVLLGDWDRAFKYLVDSNPAMNIDTEINVTHDNLHAAVLLAFVEQRRNRNSHANALLTKAEIVVKRVPRMGMGGHGIRDVQILVLRGRENAAIEALEEAVDQGYVGAQPFDGWPFALDPIIEALRSDPRFNALQERMEMRLVEMSQNVRDARSNEDWSTLMAKTEAGVAATLARE